MLAALHKSRRRIRVEVDVDTRCGPAPKPPFMRLFDLPSSPVGLHATGTSRYPTVKVKEHCIAVAQVESAPRRTWLAITRATAPRQLRGFRSKLLQHRPGLRRGFCLPSPRRENEPENGSALSACRKHRDFVADIERSSRRTTQLRNVSNVS